jgi:hypothetical protein
MGETTRTALFCLAALVLAVAAGVVDPETATPEVFSDQGEVFFPRFTDPLAAKTLEVIEYDEATATARPFKVEFRRGRWVIPSHHNYPADARDRLAKTAGALVDLKRDQVVSDLVDDHAKYGVIDPLDPKVASLTGRGKRLTLRDEQGQMLADLILGQAVPEKSGYRYVRLPEQKRTYAAKTEADPSARFEDWIETDLLKVSAGDIRRITVNSYSINEMLGRLENIENTVLVRENNRWTSPVGDNLNTAAINALVAALANLKIVGVQPKPANLTADLKVQGGIQMSMDSMLSLRQRGFFITPDGRLLSNAGEIIAETANGLVYILRFGEVVTSMGQVRDQTDAKPATPVENRYLFVTVSYDPARAAKYAGDGATPASGERLARELTSRFAEWYYVISGTDVNKLRPRRRDLVRG